MSCSILGKIVENFGYQNVLGQSDRRIFKATTSLEKNNKKV